MNYRLTTEQRLDVIVGSRLFNSCWFITNVGMAICQMMLLAQTWQQSHRAAVTACVAGAWIAGSMLLSGLSSRKWRSPRLWGVIFVLSSLLWQRIPLVPDFLVSAFSLGMLLRVCQLVVIGFLMGMLSTAWLIQRRPWPSVEERVALA